MKFEIDFPFDHFTKGDLISFCYGKHANVDPAIPMQTAKLLREFFNDGDAARFYVMDYTGDNSIFGKLVNLKEKFFERLHEIHEEQFPYPFEETMHGNGTGVYPFRFYLSHDKGVRKIVVYSSSEQAAREALKKAENCPDSAIIKREQQPAI